MLLICEAILIVLGGYMLLSGRIDIGGVRASGRNVRLAGAVLMAPLAFGVLAAPVFLTISGGQITTDLLLAASCVELIVVLGALSVASQLVRQARSESGGAGAPVTSPFTMRMPTPAPQQDAPSIMTVAEAAAYLRVSEQDVLDLIDEGKLPAARVGGAYRIARRAVDDYLGGDDALSSDGSPGGAEPGEKG
jgi:excisionase family DNA binding protein